MIWKVLSFNLSKFLSLEEFNQNSQMRSSEIRQKRKLLDTCNLIKSIVDIGTTQNHLMLHLHNPILPFLWSSYTLSQVLKIVLRRYCHKRKFLGYRHPCILHRRQRHNNQFRYRNDLITISKHFDFVPRSINSIWSMIASFYFFNSLIWI